MAVVELHVNATFYDQHLDALKSVYEKKRISNGWLVILLPSANIDNSV